MHIQLIVDIKHLNAIFILCWRKQIITPRKWMTMGHSYSNLKAEKWKHFWSCLPPVMTRITLFYESRTRILDVCRGCVWSELWTIIVIATNTSKLSSDLGTELLFSSIIIVAATQTCRPTFISLKVFTIIRFEFYLKNDNTYECCPWPWIYVYTNWTKTITYILMVIFIVSNWTK